MTIGHLATAFGLVPEGLGAVFAIYLALMHADSPVDFTLPVATASTPDDRWTIDGLGAALTLFLAIGESRRVGVDPDE